MAIEYKIDKSFFKVEKTALDYSSSQLIPQLQKQDFSAPITQHRKN